MKSCKNIPNSFKQHSKYHLSIIQKSCKNQLKIIKHILSNSMDSHENPCKPMGTHGAPRGHKGIHGDPTGSHGAPWGPMGPETTNPAPNRLIPKRKKCGDTENT